MEHTPGPWSTNLRLADERGESVAITADNGQYVGCADAVLEGQYDTTMNEANAKLMAASPDLLEALKKLLEDHEYGAPFPETWDIARAAIEAAS